MNNMHNVPVWKPYSTEGCNFTFKIWIDCCIGGANVLRRLGLICRIFDNALAINQLDLSAEGKAGACVSSDFSSPLSLHHSKLLPQKINEHISKTIFWTT